MLTFKEDCIPHSGMSWLVSGASTTGTWTRWTAAGTWFCWTCNSPWNLDTTRKDHYEIDDKDEIRCSMVAGHDPFTHVVWSQPLQIRCLTRKVHYFVLLARQTWRTDCWVAVGDNGANILIFACRLRSFQVSKNCHVPSCGAGCLRQHWCWETGHLNQEWHCQGAAWESRSSSSSRHANGLPKSCPLVYVSWCLSSTFQKLLPWQGSRWAGLPSFPSRAAESRQWDGYR